MADIEPLRALRYDLGRTDGLQDVLAPPYDVIDPQQRAALEARSPYNVVRIDLPQPQGSDDRYAHAAVQLAAWRREGALVRDAQPAVWALAQTYRGPDGAQRTRRGFLARVRLEDYGHGRIRPHERTHPGPKEDRLALMRATKANLSPIFSLFSDPDQTAWRALEPSTTTSPWAETIDDDGTRNRLWRIEDHEAIETVQRTLADAELLIADGHHRYETARAYAEEIGGEGGHRYVLMCLVSLQDQGLTVFPTHRLVRDLGPDQREGLAAALRRDFDLAPLSSPAELAPPQGTQVRIGYLDSRSLRPLMLTLKDQAIMDTAVPDSAEAYRRLDTAVLETLVLKGALQMSDADIDHLDGLGYARDFDQALELVHASEFDAAFFMAPTPIEHVQAVAATGQSMPPKSTYFFPKVPTGLAFNLLSE